MYISSAIWDTLGYPTWPQLLHIQMDFQKILHAICHTSVDFLAIIGSLKWQLNKIPKISEKAVIEEQ